MPSEHRPYGHVLVPLDGSAESQSILDHVIPLAIQFHSRVTLVEVIDTVAEVVMETAASGESAGLVIDPEPIVEAERAAADDYLGRLADQLRAAGVDVEVRHPGGQPATVIFDLARELGVDLIAMATHARTGLGRLILGSVADHALHNAPCPVLLSRID